jgi:two-component system OmpR family response regulator
MRVLIVEDEPDLARAIARAMVDERWAVDTSPDGEDGLYRALGTEYDVIVLDLMLPRQSGWHVLAELRRAGRRTPVLMLTARDAVEDRVRGLDEGADDYLTKPFAIAELTARIRALVRRAADQPAPEIRAGNVRIDTITRRVRRAGVEVELTAREYGILELLARRRGGIVTRTAISEHLYNDDSELMSNAIDVHVAALRRKLGFDIIRTRRGIGYLLDPPEPGAE